MVVSGSFVDELVDMVGASDEVNASAHVRPQRLGIVERKEDAGGSVVALRVSALLSLFESLEAVEPFLESHSLDAKCLSLVVGGGATL